MTSAIEQFLQGRIQEAPAQKPKNKHSQLEDALLAQVHALKLFKPDALSLPDHIR